MLLSFPFLFVFRDYVMNVVCILGLEIEWYMKLTVPGPREAYVVDSKQMNKKENVR